MSGSSSVVEKYKDVPKLLKMMYGEIDEKEFIVSHVLNKSLFEFIVATVLSQNTSDKNALKALNSLRKAFGGEVSPERIVELDQDKLAEILTPAGMQRERARIIKQLAERFADDSFVKRLVSDISSGDIEYARLTLKSLPGIGDKTADVILLMYFGKPTFPVDTHIARITVRLMSSIKRNYGDIRRFWMKTLDPKSYLATHLLLITHGRKTCKSKKPLCNKCLLKTLCDFYQSIRDVAR